MLIDRNNWAVEAPKLKAHLASADWVGIDCETQDDGRHDGLNRFCGYNPITRKKPKTKRTVFDMRRTVLCGVSFWTEDMKEPVYLNVGHADVDNRLTHDQLKEILAAKKQGGFWIAHNAPFEITVFRSVLDWDLSKDIVCSLQMAVSAYGPTQYSHEKWMTCGVAGITALIPDIVRESMVGYDEATGKMSARLEELLGKITAKESKAEHSWNGVVASICYGYGLKQAVKSFFNVDMTTYDQCLNGKAHMGQLTGAETAAYGGDDAYWAVKLFRKFQSMMDVEELTVFFQQENPMVGVYADIWCGGLRIDTHAVEARMTHERGEAAKQLRLLRTAVKKLLPFESEPKAALTKREPWYEKNHDKYRKRIANWALMPDTDSDVDELSRARGSVSAGWMEEEGRAQSNGPNFSHYMPVRVLLYDLIGLTPLVEHGKVQSDGEARGKLKDKAAGAGVEIIDCLAALAGIDQRMKLFIHPYGLLADPDTSRMYPVVSSMLATRRMAASTPNPMQLAKRGESTYVRGFFKADDDEQVIISIDWSAVELVEIGEFSGDPEFIKAFGQLPHADLHSGAAASILEIECPGLDVDQFKALRTLDKWSTFGERYGASTPDYQRLTHNLKGEAITPSDAYKYWRTEIGKGSNFSFWYSGYLATIGERMGWGPERTSAATRKYQELFHVAEAWRVALIEQVQRDGYVRMPDGHKYHRYEATNQWFNEWCTKFTTYDKSLRGYEAIMRKTGARIARRSGNQTVNAFIQGTCGTLAKRSTLRVNDLIRRERLKARFMIPIHDELVWSVHRKDAPEFIEKARGIMIDHPDMFQKCKLDASPSVGLTFEPWNVKKAPLGQVELFELPEAIVGKEWADKRADAKRVEQVIEHLFDSRSRTRTDLVLHDRGVASP